MSGDYETAIRFGATHVRVGTAIFGARAPRAGLSLAIARRSGVLDLCVAHRLSLGTVAPVGRSVWSIAMPTGGSMLKACLIGCSLSLLIAGSALRGRRCGQRREGLQALRGLPRARRHRRTGSARICSGVVGRTAGTVEGFKYSEAMIQHGKDGLVWNDETLDSISTDPKAFVPKNKMAFPGLKKPEERADVIAYLDAGRRK